MRILLAEDNHDMAELWCFLLTQSGYQCTVAATGREALQQLETNLPDVLVCDLYLPETDGWAVLRAIRSRSEWQHLPVVVTTGADLGELVELPAAAIVLQKPFAPPVLLDVIEQISNRLTMTRPREHSGQADKLEQGHEK